MTSCCPPPRMRWSGATDAIARCKRVSTGCGRKRRSVPAWPWICGVKPTPKAVNTPSPHCIVHGLDKPGGFTTVSTNSDKLSEGCNIALGLALLVLMAFFRMQAPAFDGFSVLFDVPLGSGHGAFTTWKVSCNL